MLIDGHVHIGKWEHLQFCGRSASLGDYMKVMQRYKIDGAILTTTDKMKNQELLDVIIRNKSKKKFWFFPWVDPDDKFLAGFINNNYKYISGLKFHPSFQKRRVTDVSYRQFIALADKMGFPVVVHCGLWKGISDFKFALDVAKKYPGVNFILSHLGGSSPWHQIESVRSTVELGLDNVFFGIEGVREYWTVNSGIKRLGDKRFIFGSDYSLGHPAMYMALVESLGITRKSKERIMGKNLLSLIRE